MVGDLVAALGERGVLSDAGDLARYEQGWRYGRGRARCVARPSTTEEVAATLRICSDAGVRVVPQGANTGLVAASTPDQSGAMVVLSLERLNQTIDLDVEDRTAVVDGGVLLSTLNEALAEHGFWFPVDLGADPQIGGMVATNTGGTRLLKYGDVRHNLLGVEVVLADGRVVSQLNRLRKNNTGLDSKQLFVGTAGAFGVVTRAALAVAPKPAQTATALVGCHDGAAVLELLGAVEQGLADFLSAFEVMGAAAMDAVFRHQQAVRRPFDEAPAYAVLVELATTLPAGVVDLDEILAARLGAHMRAASAGVSDVLLDASADFWQLRHHVSESLRSDGEMVAFDVSVARSRLPALTERVRAYLGEHHPRVWLCDYGHWGDGGSHLNVLWSRGDVVDVAGLKATLQEAIYTMVVREFDGSFSAEHGVGPHNQRFYDAFTDDAVKQLCRSVGSVCDPRGLLGNVQLG